MTKNSETKEKESGYHGHLLYKFYADPLKIYWKKREDSFFYRIIDVLQKKKTDIRRNLGRDRSVPSELLQEILFLLIETDFHQQFFDIGLMPRIDHFSSERKAMKHYRHLSLLVSEEDRIWGRWLKLYELRYDFNENEYSAGKNLRNQQEKLFKEIDEDIEHNLPGFMGYLNKLENCRTDLKQSKKKEIFNDLKKELYFNISSKFRMINLFFQLSFYETWREWLRNEYLYRREDEEGRKAAEEKIDSLKAKADDVLKEMEDMNFRENHSAFYEDYRMMRLYHLGNNLIGTKTAHFKDIISDERCEYLKEGERLSEQMKPEPADTFQYHIWFEYYRYLHLQRKMEHCLAENRIREGLIKAEDALNALRDLEYKIQGGLSKILLKVKYQKRCLEYIKSSLEAMLLEKELEQPYGFEYRINEQQQANKDTSFERIQAWMKKIRKHLFSAAL